MVFQNCKSPNFENFETPNLGVLRQNDIWVQAPWPNTNNTIKGKVGGFPQVQAMGSLVSLCLPMVHSCTKSALTNLLFGICRFVWIIDPFVIHLNPNFRALHGPLPLKCCKPKSVPQLIILSLFSHLDSKLNVLGSLGVHQFRYCLSIVKYNSPL
jgi:hypothetical protein